MEATTEKPSAGAAGESSRVVRYDESAKVRRSHGRAPERRKRWRRFKKRSDWWFASTAIPLLAATLGPLANVLSIAALVTSWRETIFVDGEYVDEFVGVKFPDPKWYVV
jgi:potassium channel subfamily K